MTFDNLGSFVV